MLLNIDNLTNTYQSPEDWDWKKLPSFSKKTNQIINPNKTDNDNKLLPKQLWNLIELTEYKPEKIEQIFSLIEKNFPVLKITKWDESKNLYTLQLKNWNTLIINSLTKKYTIINPFVLTWLENSQETIKYNFFEDETSNLKDKEIHFDIKKWIIKLGIIAMWQWYENILVLDENFTAIKIPSSRFMNEEEKKSFFLNYFWLDITKDNKEILKENKELNENDILYIKLYFETNDIENPYIFHNEVLIAWLWIAIIKQEINYYQLSDIYYKLKNKEFVRYFISYWEEVIALDNIYVYNENWNPELVEKNIDKLCITSFEKVLPWKKFLVKLYWEENFSIINDAWQIEKWFKNILSVNVEKRYKNNKNSNINIIDSNNNISNKENVYIIYLANWEIYELYENWNIKNIAEAKWIQPWKNYKIRKL